MTRWHRIAIYAALALGWAAFAAWQYCGYRHEEFLIHETLHQQSHSVTNALVGGIRSHRRLGRFFEAQLEAMLQELVRSQDVVAVAVKATDDEPIISAGKTDLLTALSTSSPGDSWNENGFQLVERFQVAPATCPLEIPHEPREGETKQHACACLQQGDSKGPFSQGGTFTAVLLLDRSRADALCRGAAWSHGLVTAAGALVLLCLALAWRASVHLVEARARTHVLESEARHLRELSQAAAGLAHETRNPIGLVRGWTQRLAQVAPESPESQDHAQTVMEECDRITARINQFLAFARPYQPSVQPVDVDRIMEELASILQPDIDTKTLSLVRQSSQPGLKVQADRELLRQALFNLVQNAIQFSPQGGTVELAFHGGHNGDARIEVADRGPGVPPAEVDALFTPYYTTRADGTGLGLAIVHRIAAAHGWHACYRARSEGGAVFSLDGIHA